MEQTKHKPEPVQPGNPHQLTRNQHIFPRASIERFRNPKTGVTALCFSEKKVIPNLDARNKLFCAKHVWDQRAEGGFGASIEGDFQSLAERLIKGDTRWLSLNHRLITRFYALWEGRARYADNPEPAVKFNAGRGTTDLTKDFKERLEAWHTSYIDEENSLPSRQATGLHMELGIMMAMREHGTLEWRLCHASPDAGEFLVPDTPANFYIPLTPTLALLGASDIDVARPNVMKIINLTALAHSRRFVIAHDWTRCFVAYNQHQFMHSRLRLRSRLNLFPDDCVAASAAANQD
ncbi:DUF4238 domain-containing protein [Burkholderia cepacia]|uniref:DUF4238 domain-containing protein n=1 Tax=Burkholderia cepacia TaxID=292 RepID=UPI001CF41667|nr:DUF4238 domain-containing protein [Burkholderia cepacia]MCA8325976.1 DUF4238 domain-containing protein [Burkholderia cepacia]